MRVGRWLGGLWCYAGAHLWSSYESVGIVVFTSPLARSMPDADRLLASLDATALTGHEGERSP